MLTCFRKNRFPGNVFQRENENNTCTSNKFTKKVAFARMLDSNLSYMCSKWNKANKINHRMFQLPIFYTFCQVFISSVSTVGRKKTEKDKNCKYIIFSYTYTLDSIENKDKGIKFTTVCAFFVVSIRRRETSVFSLNKCLFRVFANTISIYQ